LMIAVSMAVNNDRSAAHFRGDTKKERSIRKPLWRGEPIKIEKIKVKGKFVSNEKFFDEDDWLKDLTITVKNTSGRIIKYIELDLVFPRPDNSSKQPVSRDHLIYGQYPLSPGELGPANPEPPVMPEAAAEIRLTDYDGTMNFLAQTDYGSSIKHLEMEIGMVIFDDDTKWSGGHLYRRDPDKPDAWILIDPQKRALREIYRPEPRAISDIDPIKGLYSFLAKASFKSSSMLIQDDPGPCTDNRHCGVNWYSQDIACTSEGVTGCAVRRDYVSCGFVFWY
jgi:hypothetical protein